MTRSTIEHDEQTTSVLLGEQDPRRGAVGLRDGPERVQRVYRVGAEQPGLSPERPSRRSWTSRSPQSPERCLSRYSPGIRRLSCHEVRCEGRRHDQLLLFRSTWQRVVDETDGFRGLGVQRVPSSLRRTRLLSGLGTIRGRVWWLCGRRDRHRDRFDHRPDGSDWG